MVLLLDIEGKILRCNIAMKNFVEKPFDEIINRSCCEVIFGDQTPIENCPFLRMKETLHRETLEVSIKDRWLNISLDPILDESDNLNGAVCIISDVTDHKKVEEAIRKSEEKYRTIIENIEEGYYEVDLAGNFIFANDPEAKTLGYSMEELIGMNYCNYTELETSKRVYEVFNQVYKTGKSIKDFSFDVIRKDGEKRSIEVSVSLIKDSEGKPIGFRGISRDVTERKHAEAKMTALQEQLRQSQKMEAIGQLAGGVAHDFNNLITVIRGYTDLILHSIDKNNPLYEDTLEIKNASEKAESLTRQLLAFSRKQILQPKVLELNTLISNMAKLLKRLIGENIELITNFSADKAKIMADPGQIEQVFINLVVNARDAMPEGGKLIIETCNLEIDEEFTHNHINMNPGPYVELSISDTGIGMSQEIKEHIFEPFFTTKEKGKGTGLGLSTVFGIVKQSGGNILVYSEPDQGTTFKIYLPRVEETLESKESFESKNNIPSQHMGNETILVVEDEEVLRKLITSVLKKRGYKIIEASDGEDALDLIKGQKENSIHLVITDLVMPRMSGPELIKKLSLLHPETKVLCISGYTVNPMIQPELLKPQTSFLRKPFAPETLAQKVCEIINGGE